MVETALNDEEFEVYSRQVTLADIGVEGQARLRRARVCVVGVGGLGSAAVQQLAGMGVGFLRLVDRDIVARSDLHRQYLYDTAHLGYPKVEAAARRLERLNPHVRVEPIPSAITSATVEKLVKDVDVVVDGLDSVEARYLVNRAALGAKVPYIYGAAIESYGTAFTLLPGQSACLECVYPHLRDEDLPRCAVVGVNPPVLSIVAGVQVAEAVRLITGRKPLLANRLLFIDLANLGFDIVDLARRPECRACGRLVKPPLLSSHSFEAACARDGRGVYFLTPPNSLSLDLDEASRRLTKLGYQPRLRTKLAASFDLGGGITFTLLPSGVGVAQVELPLEDLEGLRERLTKLHQEVVAGHS